MLEGKRGGKVWQAGVSGCWTAASSRRRGGAMALRFRWPEISWRDVVFGKIRLSARVLDLVGMWARPQLPRFV